MSVFSDALSQLIDSRKIKVYDMIRYLEIDRSTMYQIIKGKRNPPADSQIEKMADFMLLTPSEREDLPEQAKITRLGKNIYYQRKGVAEFMCGFPNPPENDLQESDKYSPNQDWQPLEITEDESEEESISYLPTEFDVHRAIRGMLQKEAKKENGCIYLQLQPGENFLFDMLRSIIPEGNLKVKQILCLSNNDEMAEGLAAMLQSNRAMLESENMHIYFTQEGLKYFADTGKFKELPDEIYIPLAPDDRVMILKELKEYCIRGTYRMLSGSLHRLAKNLRLCINGNMGYLLFNEKDSRVIYMFFTEPSLLFMFTDFIENVEEKDFASNDEAVAVIEKVCRQMERDEQSPS